MLGLYLPTNQLTIDDYRFNVKQRSDKLINYFLISFYIAGLLLAVLYDTWNIAIGVGSINLLAYYSTKWALPKSTLYQYVLSVCLGIFMAQFIYQMHGLFEMHFFAFIGSAILITYQNWKLQIPLLIYVTVHHLGLNYLQSIGIDGVYFTSLGYFEAGTMAIHIFLTTVIFFICGLWAYNLNKFSGSQLTMLAHIQQRKLYEEELERLNGELRLSHQIAVDAMRNAKLADEAKRTFLATMSHEIRTPMNGVMGMTSLLSETTLTHEQTDYVNVINTSGDALLTVINDILDFSKIESGHLEFEQESFDLIKCIENVIDLFANRATLQGLDLLYEIGLDVPHTYIGDSHRIRQILINLINNAIKFTDKGEVHIQVKKESVQGDKVTLLFDIRDTGIGIPQEKLVHLFKAFSQVDSSNTRKYGGTGLGLVISERLIHLMNGKIKVNSIADEGTVFSFTLELLIDLNKKTIPLLHDFKSNEGKRILIVDDNLTNLRIIKARLELWSFTVTAASGPLEALEQLTINEGFSLIITDMHMPEMDGAQLAQAIRHRNIAIPIILLSSVGDESKFKHPGLFVDVLSKPAKNDRLHDLIHQTLYRNRSDAELPLTDKAPSLFDGNFARKFPLRILMAEDNLINMKLGTIILNKLGYKADYAEDGQQAVNMFKAKYYDLILMDIMMPRLNGLEASEIIRAIDGPQPTIIAMTANAMQEDKNKCMEAGMNDYLPKPIDINLLIEILKTVKKGNEP